MIPEAAVEAALRVTGGPVLAIMNERGNVRRILEAAAPFIQAQAWEEGRDAEWDDARDGWNKTPNPYRSQP